MSRPTSKPATGLLSGSSLPKTLIERTLRAKASPHTRRSYAKGIAEMYAFADGRPVTLDLLQEWRLAMAKVLAASTVNNRITAVRALIEEGRRSKFLGGDEAWELLQIEGLPQRGTRKGNWLTVEQVRLLLCVPSRKTVRGLRNYCILAILIGCAIRVEEAAKLEVATLQQRDGRWVLADLIGKGGRVRTVAVPGWVKAAIDAWMKAAKIAEGRIIRQLNGSPDGLSTETIREIVQKTAAKIGVPKCSPHDLRRTCAKLAREQGGDLEQIQEMLGHASLNTTQRYLGTRQNLRHAPNDKLGL